MRIKTSVTLSEKALRTLDRLAVRSSGRSRIVEQAIEEYAAARARALRDARDMEAINRRADELNREVGDALDYQEAP